MQTATCFQAIPHAAPAGGPPPSAGRYQRIRELLAWQFGVAAGDIHTDTHLIEDLYADSLDLVEMTHMFNREFGIDIDADYLACMHTVADALAVVDALRDTAHPASGKTEAGAAPPASFAATLKEDLT